MSMIYHVYLPLISGEQTSIEMLQVCHLHNNKSIGTLKKGGLKGSIRK